ncbi:QacE family quaternary ammonium compound efflux SMR transporter [Thalassobacillus devorans]|uniref:QacE family quaternary ammonium compound efflux SMR transporter n=1 Tax=Thalassobacillus devorans TaxID=279813 RepID=A0ABQ1PEA1_9BACI|nr:multidrug efflux SMR transporter [Thalassobacillus devorans]NIK29289.1 multidrug resistance protein EbrA [Thalassobacillus devorans]GGC95524.1 QacE family quaternary ammonium compound efflux SMR transporter [Thalassobacillus devorans]
MYAYGLLMLAIISEVFGSAMLKASNGFKNKLAVIGVVSGYGLAFYCLALSLNMLPLSVAYAIWAGLGTALTALVGITIYKEKFNRKNVAGLMLIIIGVTLLNMAGSH